VVDGGTLRVWSIEGAPQGGGASPVDAPIASLRPFAGGLLTVHANGGLTRWSSGAWEPTLIDAGGITLEDALITADGASAVTVDYYGRVSTWDLRAGTQVTSDNRFASGETTGVAMSDDGLLGVASSSGRVVVLDGSLTSQTSIQVSASPEYVGAVAFQPSTDAVATGIAERRSATSFDDSVTLWDGQEPSPRFRVGGEQQEVVGCSFFYSRIRFSHDGSTMAVTSHDFSVVLVDPTSGEVLKELAGDTSVLDVAFTPDDRLLVATYDNATVNVWETAGYSPVASYQGSPGGYSAIAMMPDSNTMAATDITGAISLIDVMTGAPERSFADAAFRTTTLALSPDGALLAAPAADATINLWSTETGTRLATLTGHTAEVTGLVFSPDSGWLASSSSDGTVRTWTLRATN
jgi:WD40 repeat protein